MRETADPSLYPRAEAALEAARELLPDDPLVLAGIGGLQLGRHEFAEALKTGQDTLRALPGYPSARCVVVDALVELGRYEDAFKAAEPYAADSPDLASMARLSYAHELRGDLGGALTAMDQASAYSRREPPVLRGHGARPVVRAPWSPAVASNQRYAAEWHSGSAWLDLADLARPGGPAAPTQDVDNVDIDRR